MRTHEVARTMIDIPIVGNDFPLDDGAFDDLRLRRRWRRARRTGPLPLPFSLDNADALLKIGGRRTAPLDEARTGSVGGRAQRSIALDDADPVNLRGSARRSHGSEADVFLDTSRLERADAPRPDVADGTW